MASDRERISKRLGEFPKAEPAPRNRVRPSVVIPRPVDLLAVAELVLEAGPNARYHFSHLVGEGPDDDYVLVTQEFGGGLEWRVDAGVCLKVSLLEDVVRAIGTVIQGGRDGR